MPSSNHVSLLSRPGQGSSTTSPRRLTLLVLLADTPVEAVKQKHGDYHDVFASLFQRSLQHLHPQEPLEIEVRSYDVVNEPWEYPTEDELASARGLLITGSAASAYEKLPWITRLVDFTAGLATSHPALKLIGICYGHQIIARAYGATVEKNAKGWELGVRTIQLTDVGKRLLLGGDTVDIHQVHQDHVPSLPDGFGGLGSTPICPVHGMVLPAEPSSIAEAKIFTLQGHPEFSPDIVTEIINVREAKGILTADFAEQSRKDAALHDQGVALGGVILNMIGA